MPGCDRGHQKELFGPWLIRQINNNRYGLRWLDQERTTFRIPWKHLSRKDLTSQDYDLFKAWAQHGGRYSEQCEDRSMWKTNFRCALNSISLKEKMMLAETRDGAAAKDKKMFIEVQDRSGDPHDPHKVYRRLQALEAGGCVPTPPAANHNGLPDNEEEEEDELRFSPDSLQILDFNMARPQLDTAPIEDILQFLSLENHNAENVPLGQSEMLNGRCAQNGYCPREMAQPVYEAVSGQNGFQGPPGTLQWSPFGGAGPVPNGCTYQQQTWVPLAVSTAPEGKAPYSDHSVQSGYAQVASMVNAVNYASRNGPVENRYQSSGAHWANQAAVECSPSQNGFASSTGAFRQDGSPQHQLQQFPITGQHHSAVTEAHYNHHGTHNGYAQEVQLGNGATYAAANVPVENNYHPSWSQWANPAVAAHSPTQNGYAFQQENSRQGPLPPSALPAQPQNLELNTPPMSSLEVTIFYKGKLVHYQPVKKRCLLSFNPADPSLGQLEAVRFPSPVDLPDQKQLENTTKLLENVQRGVLLEVEPSQKKLVATRLGKCKVFWAMSEQRVNLAESTKERMLPRETPMEIFDFNRFFAELKDYRDHMRASPDYSIDLCFGQCLNEKSKEKKLIMVKIVPRFCSFFHELVQREGASSLNSESFSLQISGGSFISLYDLIDSASLMEFDF